MCCIDPLRLALYRMLYKSRLAKRYRSVLRLPLVTSLPDHTKVIVHMMTDDQLTTTYQMLEEGCKLGQGFGMNEFSSLEDFRFQFKRAHRFSVTMATGEHAASLLITESRYSRGVNVADPYVIVKASRRGQGLGTLCLQLCEDFSRLLGFLGLYAETFSNNSTLIRQIRGIDGYRLVGTLPAGGLMPDGTVVSTLVYYKDLRRAAGADPGGAETSEGESTALSEQEMTTKSGMKRRRRKKKDASKS